MWIFCKCGFFSAVQHRDNPDILLVRGKFRGDLERLLDRLSPEERESCSSVTESPNADAPYQMEMPKHVFAKFVAEISNEIDYGNYKLGDCYHTLSQKASKTIEKIEKAVKTQIPVEKLNGGRKRSGFGKREDKRLSICTMGIIVPPKIPPKPKKVSEQDKPKGEENR